MTLALSMGKQQVYSAEVGALVASFWKSATELKPKQKSFKWKSTVHIVTLNVRTLIWIGRLPELTALVAEHNIDIVCVQEHRYHFSKVKIKCNDTGNGWTFISVSAWKSMPS